MEEVTESVGSPIGVRFSPDAQRRIRAVAASIEAREKRSGVSFGEAAREVVSWGLAAMDGEATEARVRSIADRLGVSVCAALSMVVAMGLETAEPRPAEGSGGGEGLAGHICSDCGRPGATLRRDDAADEEHWFHEECWADLAAFLAGKDGAGRGDDAEAGKDGAGRGDDAEAGHAAR